MKYRLLGQTGLWVSELSFGAMTLGGSSESPIWGAVGALPIEESEKLVRAALDAGINHIDTADVYGEGESEAQLGQILAGRRDQVIIGTKAMARSGPGPNDLGATRLHLTRSIDASLRRLRTDYIDLYQLHNFDHLTPLEETLTALDDAVRQGKIRYIGAANFAAWQVSKALGISALRQVAGFVALQEHYSLLVRDIEADVVPMAQNENVGITVWGPLAGGYLTGKYDQAGATSETSARRAKAARQSLPPVDPAAAAPVLDVVRAVAARIGASVPQVALAWLLQRPAVTSVIIGARTMDQLANNLASVDVVLSDQDIAELDAVSAPALRYPKWMNDYAETVRGPIAA